jgi:cell division septation protein DedD
MGTATGRGRLGRLQKVATLVPLALLSAAASVAVAGGGNVGSPASASAGGGTLPDGSTVPDEAIEAPASLSTRAQLAPGVKGDPDEAVDSAAANGIPSAALAAYLRAETVINAADTTCHLPWQLVAAIGRVESDHGRFHGSHLDDDGLARPAIYGIPLDGTRGTSRIDDTDAGLLDGDARFDRAVGPMQFIPSTWSVVGVDADGDGKRDPQDVDDASLATAVYLCSGDDDLATDAGRRSSVFRYNHSTEYVALVLAFYDAYVAGDYSSVPNISGGGTFPPSGGGGNGGGGNGGGGNGGGGGGQPTADPQPTDGPTSKPTPTPAPTSSPTPQPTAQPTPTQQPSATKPADPTKTPTATPTSAGPTLLPTALPTILPSDLPTSVLTPILSVAEAILQCTAQGLVNNPLSNTDAFDQCVDNLSGG